jgi:hypothetical protein
LPSRGWRVLVRRQGHSLSRTFRLKAEAEAWAAKQENRIGRGEKPSKKPVTSRETLGDLPQRHKTVSSQKQAASHRSARTHGYQRSNEWRRGILSLILHGFSSGFTALEASVNAPAHTSSNHFEASA